jgi:heme-degrading monooxygenase HmoA
MAEADSYASGNWKVKEGNEEQFVSRWTEFLQWSRDNAKGSNEANLLRDQGDARHFVSFGRFDDDESQEGWRALPEFRQKLGACVELCEDFQGGAFTRSFQFKPVQRPAAPGSRTAPSRSPPPHGWPRLSRPRSRPGRPAGAARSST